MMTTQKVYGSSQLYVTPVEAPPAPEPVEAPPVADVTLQAVEPPVATPVEPSVTLVPETPSTEESADTGKTSSKKAKDSAPKEAT